MKNNIGDKIKKLRLEKNLSQVELSEKLNITQASLSAYERKTKLPSLDVLIKICNFFETSLDWLCGLEPQTRFYTGTDFINMFLKVKSLPKTKYDIKVEDKYVAPASHYYITTLTFTGEIEPQLRLNSREIFDNNAFGEIMQEYDELEKKLESLGDNELSADYKKMWLEKKFLEYSKTQIINPED